MYRRIDKELVTWKNSKHRKPLILRGARQVGKTYSLLNFAETNFPNHHYINFEKNKKAHKAFSSNLDPANIVELLSVELNLNINQDDLLIFDEIQACPNALTALKYFAEDAPKQAVVSAGSLLGLRFNDVSFPVGKVDYLDLFPMTFIEFLQASKETKLLKYINKNLNDIKEIPELVHEKLWDKLKIYFIIGGLPEVVDNYINSKSQIGAKFRSARRTQTKILDSYIDDMMKHSGKENSMHIERLWRNIPGQLSQTHDGSAPKFQFKNIIPGIKSYARLVNIIDWLEATGLIIKVKIAHRAELPLIAFSKENFFKLFIFDIGILGLLSDLSPKNIMNYDYGNYKGYFAENFVAQELRASLGIKHDIYSWHEGEAEIEFLLNQSSSLIPLEVKSGNNTQSKSLKSFADRYNTNHAIIVSGQNFKHDSKKKIFYYPLYLAGQLHTKDVEILDEWIV